MARSSACFKGRQRHSRSSSTIRFEGSSSIRDSRASQPSRRFVRATCFGNLAQHLAQFGIEPHQIPTTFNIFMNVEVAPNRELTIGPPKSRAGGFIELRAEMDLVVGVTACSAEKSNNHSFKPIDIEIRSADEL
ncbi:MAG: DUF1989 domain-containing protein [Polyangiaceae bacterium]